MKETITVAHVTESPETVNAKGALGLLAGIDITKDEIEIWIPRVMRYTFRLTPVNVMEFEST
jgi:hypothetical protein